MTARNQTMVTFVLDETSSMDAIKSDTIGGFNEYLHTLKKSRKNIRFSLIKFNSNKTTKVCVDEAMADVSRLSDKTYNPAGMTPLVDACCKAIKATAEKVGGRGRTNVIVAIQTDGEENCSTEFTSQDLARLVKEKTAAGWVFLFLGAGIDAFGAAREYGIPTSSTMTYDRDMSHEMFGVTAANTVAFAETGSRGSARYTSSQRRATGGHMPPGQSPKPPAGVKKKPGLVDDITL